VSYLNQAEMAENYSMISRVAQCATQQEIPDADAWTQTNRRAWAAAPGWDDAWASARASHADDTQAYDPGADEAVITDSMILSQVQEMMSEAA
jgi:hypothetical protein